MNVAWEMVADTNQLSEEQQGFEHFLAKTYQMVWRSGRENHEMT